MEEDTGKTVHGGATGRIGGADYALEDYNRAGVPLVEVVSEPDIRTPEEARAYLTELRATLESLGVSDVRMEEGSLRCDANISLRRRGDHEFGTKIEVKNLNSIRSLYRALRYEQERQVAALTGGEPLIQETRHWDENKGVTTHGRSKEYAFDYRYFPEPDLAPLEPDPEWIEKLRADLPELPAARRARFAGPVRAGPQPVGHAHRGCALGVVLRAGRLGRRVAQGRGELDDGRPRRAPERVAPAAGRRERDALARRRIGQAP